MVLALTAALIPQLHLKLEIIGDVGMGTVKARGTGSVERLCLLEMSD